MVKNTQENFERMIDNMLRLHFPYEEIYEEIKVCFPTRNITFDEMLDIITERLIKIIK